MAIDNQLVIGILVFAGLGYYIFQKKETSEQEKKNVERAKEAGSILQEFDTLRERIHTFEHNDKKKGRNRKKTPLEKGTRSGLVEVITRLKELDKRQSRTQGLSRDEARKLHADVSHLDRKIRDYLDRYERFKKGRTVDPRQVASKQAEATKAAFARGALSRTRSKTSFVADQGKDDAFDKRWNKSKNKKPFVQNQKPKDVLKHPVASDNTVRNEQDQSAFETNNANDDTLDHGDKDADMEEANLSGAHGKEGQKIRPLDRKAPPKDLSRETGVDFDGAQGAVADKDRIKRVTEKHRSKSGSVVRDVSADVSELSDELMEKDLLTNLEQLDSHAIRLDDRLNKKLTAIIAQIYFDEPDEGDEKMVLLRQFRARDMGLDIISSIPKAVIPRRRKNKRDASQVIDISEVTREEKAMSKRHQEAHIKVDLIRQAQDRTRERELRR